MKKLIKRPILVYSFILVITTIIAYFCGRFWGLPIFAVSLSYFIYCMKNIQFEKEESLKQFNMGDVRFPAKGYDNIYFTHLLNLIYLIAGIFGILLLFL